MPDRSRGPHGAAPGTSGDDFLAIPSDTRNVNDEADFSWTPNDVRHRVTLGAVVPLPGGFQLSTGFQWNTGKPFSAFVGVPPFETGRGINPDTGAALPRNECVYGGRDHCRTGGFLSWDMRLSKTFTVGRGRFIEVLFEVFNLTDHVNFNRDSYVMQFTSENFGTPTAIVRNSQPIATARAFMTSSVCSDGRRV